MKVIAMLLVLLGLASTAYAGMSTVYNWDTGEYETYSYSRSGGTTTVYDWQEGKYKTYSY